MRCIAKMAQVEKIVGLKDHIWKGILQIWNIQISKQNFNLNSGKHG